MALPFLTSALDGGEWLASRPCRFIPWEGASGTHWIGGWGDPEPVWTPWKREKTLPLPGIDYRPCSP
jgi:hypothetical protein